MFFIQKDKKSQYKWTYLLSISMVKGLTCVGLYTKTLRDSVLERDADTKSYSSEESSAISSYIFIHLIPVNIDDY